MSRRNLAWLISIAAVSLFGFAVSYSAPTRERDKDYELVHLLVDVLQEVRSKYVVEVDPERERKLVEDMITGGLERLDPHSSYINPREYKQFNKSSKGKFGGIGIQVGYDRQNRGQLTVISPMVGTPAYEGGILAGDLILKIDGKSTDNMHHNEAVDLIQGEKGEKITLTVLHEGGREPVDIPLVRDEIQVQSVLGDQRKANDPKAWDFMLDKENKIGYIRLTQFTETAAADVKAAVEGLQRDGVRGLILDLRNNPGGLLRAAVEISDLFLTEGRIVSTKGRNQKEEVYDAKPEGTLLEPADRYPIVVLVNKFSASASEIVSAALQDHHRAVVIGERSYGKGSVQNIILMEHETSALKLTTASYWRPSGKNIHRFPDSKENDEWGVKPNPGFEVPMKDDERFEFLQWRSERDIVRGKKGAPEAKAEEKKAEDKKQAKVEEKKSDDKKQAKAGDKKDEKKPFTDRVLDKAVDYLRKEVQKLGAAPDVFLRKSA
jgi:carboxyl-terminal processing protease